MASFEKLDLSRHLKKLTENICHWLKDLSDSVALTSLNRTDIDFSNPLLIKKV